MLWWNFYAKTLKDLGFSIDTYDRCVANKIFDLKKCTIVLYVDDNNISYVYPNVITDIL